MSENSRARCMGRKRLRQCVYYYPAPIVLLLSKKNVNDTPYVCLTVDLCSANYSSFLGVTAHWLTK